MADSKISNLPAMTSMSDDDIFVVVDSPGGSPTTKKITKSNLLGSYSTTDTDTTYNATAPITVTGTTIAIPKASTSVNGYLSSADWDTFNEKSDVANLGDLTDVVSTTSAGYVLTYNGTTSVWEGQTAASGGAGGSVAALLNTYTGTGLNLSMSVDTTGVVENSVSQEFVLASGDISSMNMLMITSACVVDMEVPYNPTCSILIELKETGGAYADVLSKVEMANADIDTSATATIHWTPTFAVGATLTAGMKTNGATVKVTFFGKFVYGNSGQDIIITNTMQQVMGF